MTNWRRRVTFALAFVLGIYVLVVCVFFSIYLANEVYHIFKNDRPSYCDSGLTYVYPESRTDMIDEAKEA